jgi:hypothetical protein
MRTQYTMTSRQQAAEQRWQRRQTIAMTMVMVLLLLTFANDKDGEGTSTSCLLLVGVDGAWMNANTGTAFMTHTPMTRSSTMNKKGAILSGRASFTKHTTGSIAADNLEWKQQQQSRQAELHSPIVALRVSSQRSGSGFDDTVPVGDVDEGNSCNNSNGKNDIKDYVLNVHGGKYQFEDSTSAGSAAGLEFASMMYGGAGGSAGGVDEPQANQDPPLEEWPNWAQRMVMVTTQISQNSSLKAELEFPCLTVPRDNDNNRVLQHVQVPITNECRTWEPYFAKIIRLMSGDDNGDGDVDVDADADADQHVSPLFQIEAGTAHGTLAPRGGAANVCDESKPYSDTAFVGIRHMHTTATANTSTDVDVGGNLNNTTIHILVVGTEEEKWHYKLALSDP